MRALGSAFIALAAVFAFAGILIYYGLFNWFGRLPGDIRIQSGAGRIYLPLGSCAVVSLGLSAALYLLRRLF